MALNNTQEVIERSFYEAIRLVGVAEGYMIDEALYPETQQGLEDMELAMAAIVTSKGFIVQLLGVGSSQSKGLKKTPRIVIEQARFSPGETGGLPTSEIITNPTVLGAFNESAMGLSTSKVYLDIHLVSNSAVQNRILHAILITALGTRNYLPLINQPEDKLFINQYSYFDIIDTQDGIIEKVYVYEAPDVWLEYSEVPSELTSIDEITTNINIEEGIAATGNIANTIPDVLLIKNLNP